MPQPKSSPPPHNHHNRARERSGDRGRSPSHVSREADSQRNPPSSRRERSNEHTSYHHHRQSASSTSHKRRLSRSPELSNKHLKRDKDGSPVALASRTDYQQTPRVRESHRAHPLQASANEETTIPSSRTENTSHHRRRSPSADSHRAGGYDRKRNHRDRGDDYYQDTRRSSPRREGRRRYSRSPPPSRGNKGARGSRRDRHSDHRPHRERSPRHDRESQIHHRSPRSPRDVLGGRHSRESLRPTSPSGNHSPRRRSASKGSHRSLKDNRDKDDEMYHHRGPYDPRYGGYPYSNQYPPSNFGSHTGSPTYGYPPQHSPYPHHQSQPGVPYYQPQTGKHYGGTPNHPQYPARAPQRGGPAARGGRGHYSNLSWTPGDGVKGGSIVKPGEEEYDQGIPAENSKPQLQSVIADPEDDDNPFRPPADLRAEDENARKKRKISDAEAVATSPTPSTAATKTTEQKAGFIESVKNKISFSIKGRASAAAAEKAPPITPKPQAVFDAAKKAPVPVSPLIQSNIPKSKNYEGNTRVDTVQQKSSPRPVKTEKVKKKRMKARPELSEDFAQSESVYYRKTGNDSVVGSGTYGKVYKAIHVYTNTPVALKKIRMEGERDGVSLNCLCHHVEFTNSP